MFGEEIKKYRKENGVSLRALAEKIGVSFTYISYIEKGRAMPAPSIIKKLAEK
jgi:transcriptional regulator with XRE-family HTH domain